MLAATSSNTSSSTVDLTCATCLTTFETKEAKRTHMKNDWHVLNLQRRLASLPPVSLMEFEAQGGTLIEPVHRQDHAIRRRYYGSRKPKGSLVMTKSPYSISSSDSNDHLSSSATDEEEASSVEVFDPTRCLFCNAMSPTLDTNLAHMSLDHSFFIPNILELIHTESFLSYLFVIISEFNECLLCGKEKTNICAVQDHMRAKGHCKIDFETEKHQLWEFYERGTDEHVSNTEEDKDLILIEDQLRLPSGKILGHRSTVRTSRQHHVHRALYSAPLEHLAIEGGIETAANTLAPSLTPNHTMTLAVRAGTFTSLIGVPELQQRALIAFEKKMEILATRTKNEYQSKLERGGNKQKRYRVLTMGKKAGGLEKRNG